MQAKEQNGYSYISGLPDQPLISNERNAVDDIGFCGKHEAGGVLLYPENCPINLIKQAF